jgi:hypothetical protein
MMRMGIPWHIFLTLLSNQMNFNNFLARLFPGLSPHRRPGLLAP